MSSVFLKQYDDFISTYEKLYHIRSNESIEEIVNLISSCLINKYKISKQTLLKSISNAINYNYRSQQLYREIESQLSFDHALYLAASFFDRMSFGRTYSDFLGMSAFRSEDFDIFIKDDQIDKFRNYVLENDLSFDIQFGNCTTLEKCAYYGAINIFNFIVKNLNGTISQKCFHNAIIGGNTDLINECLKHHPIDAYCLNNAIGSHNNTFLKYILDHDLIDAFEFDFQAVLESQNLKAVFLLFEKDKNLIFPWCAAFPQTYDILKNNKFEKYQIFPQNVFGRTALHFASLFNCTEICRLLLDSTNGYKIDIESLDDYQYTPLLCAVSYNNKEAVEFLISKGANLNAINNQGKSPLCIAIDKFFPDMAKLLISNGANINYINPESGLHYLHICIKNHMDEITELLISKCEDINIKSSEQIIVRDEEGEELDYGMTPLHYAVLTKNYLIFNLLISHGADVNAKDSFGKTALFYIVNKHNRSFQYIHIVMNFVTKQTENLQNEEIHRETKEIVKTLISRGANINEKDKSGKTALHYAAFYSDIESIEIFISHGADVNAKDKIGKSPLHWA